MRHLASITTRNAPWAKNICKIKLYQNICFRFILITHNSDYPVPRHRSDLKLLKHPLLIRWFAQNVAHEYMGHEKMEAIPIGLPNQRVRQYQLSDIEPHLEYNFTTYLNQQYLNQFYSCQDCATSLQLLPWNWYDWGRWRCFPKSCMHYLALDHRPDFLFASFTVRDKFRKRAMLNFEEIYQCFLQEHSCVYHVICSTLYLRFMLWSE